MLRKTVLYIVLLMACCMLASDAHARALPRQLVAYQTKLPAGSIVVDTPHFALYFVQEAGTAIRYSVGVGREGFGWSGTEKVSRKAEWPPWFPPKAMLERQPELRSVLRQIGDYQGMPGGPRNPLGARAIYLGQSEYRIHGTSDPNSIGQRMSSGCIRLLNEDVMDLYERVEVGATVMVLQ